MLNIRYYISDNINAIIGREESKFTLLLLNAVLHQKPNSSSWFQYSPPNTTPSLLQTKLTLADSFVSGDLGST